KSPMVAMKVMTGIMTMNGWRSPTTRYAMNHPTNSIVIPASIASPARAQRDRDDRAAHQSAGTVSGAPAICPPMVINRNVDTRATTTRQCVGTSGSERMVGFSCDREGDERYRYDDHQRGCALGGRGDVDGAAAPIAGTVTEPVPAPREGLRPAVVRRPADTHLVGRVTSAVCRERITARVCVSDLDPVRGREQDDTDECHGCRTTAMCLGATDVRPESQ